MKNLILVIIISMSVSFQANSQILSVNELNKYNNTIDFLLKSDILEPMSKEERKAKSSIEDLSCVNCVGGVLTTTGSINLPSTSQINFNNGDMTLDNESLYSTKDATCFRFYGSATVIELGGENSNLELTGSGSKILVDGSNCFVEIGSGNYIKYSNNQTGSGTPTLGSNCPANTLSAPYTWLKMKSSDGSRVYVPAWK